MMNGVGIWDIVTYVQKRAVLQTQSIQNVHISFSLNGSHITQWHFCMRHAPSHIKYSSIVNLMVCGRWPQQEGTHVNLSHSLFCALHLQLVPTIRG